MKRTEEERDIIPLTTLERSAFTAKSTVNDDDHLIAFSTFSYQYVNACYVLVCCEIFDKYFNVLFPDST